jgi:hypothetical protein
MHSLQPLFNEPSPHAWERAQARARHIDHCEDCARWSQYELFLWKLRSNVAEGESEPHMPTFEAWQRFYYNGGHHA